MYVCMYAFMLVLFYFSDPQSLSGGCRLCRYIYACVSEHDNTQIMLSIELLFGDYVTGHSRKFCIHFCTNRLTGFIFKQFFNHFATKK